MDFSIIVGFPTPMLDKDEWEECIHKFREGDKDILSQHLMDLHSFMYHLGIYDEYVMMKLLMTYLKGGARKW